MRVPWQTRKYIRGSTMTERLKSTALERKTRNGSFEKGISFKVMVLQRQDRQTFGRGRFAGSSAAAGEETPASRANQDLRQEDKHYVLLWSAGPKLGACNWISSKLVTGLQVRNPARGATPFESPQARSHGGHSGAIPPQKVCCAQKFFCKKI